MPCAYAQGDILSRANNMSRMTKFLEISIACAFDIFYSCTDLEYVTTINPLLAGCQENSLCMVIYCCTGFAVSDVQFNAGGGRELCPDAIVDDGLLDVSYVMNVSPDKIGPIMGKLVDGDSSVSDLKDVLGNLRCDWLEVDCPDELQVKSQFASPKMLGLVPRLTSSSSFRLTHFSNWLPCSLLLEPAASE